MNIQIQTIFKIKTTHNKMKYILLVENFDDPVFNNLTQSQTIPNVVLMLNYSGNGGEHIFYNCDPWMWK